MLTAEQRKPINQDGFIFDLYKTILSKDLEAIKKILEGSKEEDLITLFSGRISTFKLPAILQPLLLFIYNPHIKLEDFQELLGLEEIGYRQGAFLKDALILAIDKKLSKQKP